MADLVDIADVGQLWGSDLRLSPTGDLALVVGSERSKERVLRRLLTNEGEYLFAQGYGGSIPKDVGEIADNAKILAKVRGQMKIEEAVLQSVPPTVTVQNTATGVALGISYITAPDQMPAALSFTVTP